MVRSLALVAAFAVGSLIAWGPAADPVEPELEPEVCCKICHKGKACGDTCIARDKACTLAPGCACDEEGLGVDA
jgi:hypothetical protein